MIRTKLTTLTAFFAIILLCSPINLKAQISQGGLPESFNHQLKDNNVVELQKPGELKSPDYKANQPYEFAKIIEVDFNPTSAGVWFKTDSFLIWQLILEAPGAQSLNFTFAPFKLQKYAKVFVYNYEKTQILGAFTEKNNKKTGQLPVQPLAGDKIVIELNLPVNVPYDSELGIRRIGYGYRGISANLENRSGACEVNVNCPEGDQWQDEKRSVAKIVINNNMLCSGALINNTKQDGHPYLLTASHCIDQWAEAENSVYIFNYESQNCDGSNIFPGQSIAVSELVATGSNNMDFTLVSLSEMPPEDYDPYYAGWNRTAEAPTQSATIHHPDGDIKKISLDYDAAVIGDYGFGYAQNSHWQILHWDVGTTEGGSSGSPLFDQEHYIVGDLTGGEADCVDPVNDFYARFDMAWDSKEDPMYQLKSWLDPIESGVEKLPGFTPYSNKLNLDVSLLEITQPEERICGQIDFTPQIKFRNRGLDTINNLIFKVIMNDETLDNFEWTGKLFPQNTLTANLNSLNPGFGDYELKIISLNPNGEIDENPDNDTIRHNFRVLDGKQIQLELLTDEYAQETSWELEDANGEVIYRSRFYQNSTLYLHDFCLTTGCYVFTIEDSEGDGICCDYGVGNFVLSNPTTGEEYLSGGEFGTELSQNLCLYPDEYKSVGGGLEYALFPNPARNYIEINLFQNPGIKIRLIDYTGKIRTELEEIKGNVTIPVSHLQNGIYFMQFYGDEHIYTEKIIISR